MHILTKMLVIGIFCSTSFAYAEGVVIVNINNADTIDDKLIKKIYLGKAKSFPNGNKVNVYSLSSAESETEVFRKQVLKKSNSQFKAYWSKLIFTGKGKPATELKSAAEIIAAVKGDPNGIGFINVKDSSSEVKSARSY